MPKARILEAVREGRDERSAQLIDHLKKGDMAREAERLLDGTGWLPEPLRPADPDAGETAPAGTGDGQAEAGHLPAFLADDDDEQEVGEAADDEAGEAAAEEELLAAE